MKQCFGYIRVSTQKQGEGVSLEAQKDAITVFASRQHLTVTKWYEEVQTAAKGGRPIFNQMLKQLKRGAARGVIIHKIDRSARNLRDWAMFSELPDLGFDVYIATETLDFNSRGGRLTADIQAVIAADYIRNLREETIKGLNGRLKQGLYPFRAPIGYLDNGKGQPKTPDPEKAPLIRQMFELYSTGQYSLRSLQAEMNRRGMRNLLGQPLSLCGVETIVNNPFYTGLIAIKRSGQTYKGVHEAIVPARLFKQVQEVKASRNGKVATRHNHLYQGLFRCGHCEGPMSPELQKGSVYYRCQTRDCPTKTIREDALEKRIVTALAKLQISPDRARELERDWSEDQCAKQQTLQIETLTLRLGHEESRLERLTDLLVDGTLETNIYNARRQKLELSIAALKEELCNRPDPGRIERDRLGFLELMKSLAALHITAEAPEKRELVENAFSNRKIVGKHVELEPYDWLRTGKAEPSVLSGAPFLYAYRTTNTSDDVDQASKSLRALLAVYKRVLGLEAEEEEVKVYNFQRRSRQATESEIRP